MMIEERTKANVRVLKLAYGGLLVALGILLPQAFHIFGQNAGMIFLPIQIPVLFAGMLLGPYYGGLIGILVPLFSSVLTGMPPVPKVYFMFVELMAYGIAAGWMIKKTNVYASLLTAMILGRAAYGISLIVGAQLLHTGALSKSGGIFIGDCLRRTGNADSDCDSSGIVSDVKARRSDI